MSEDIWYYARSGQQIGPVSRAQLEQLVSGGQVLPGDFVWTAGMPQWEPAGKVFAAYVSQPSMPPPMPQSPMGTFAGGGPTGFYGQYPIAIEYAGFWLRFVAWFIDLLILSVLGFVLVGCGGAIIVAVIVGPDASHAQIRAEAERITPYIRIAAVIFSWLYNAILESSSRQATFGKSAMGLIVTDLDGRRLSFGQASIRFFSRILSAVIAFMGFVMIAFTERKQGLHDLIAKTLVMKRPGQ